MISVIIPTYQSPDALELCLKSTILGQRNKNQIIVVIDGFYDINKQVLEKWKQHIDVLNLEENVGLCRGTNLGVYNACYEKILIVNDDNVFPDRWDETLLRAYQFNTVISPNQIEPYASIFEQFNIHDLGRSPQSFDMTKFWEYEKSLSKNVSDQTGSTLPIFMAKVDYLRLGGWDENYKMGVVADWDFFLKCNLSKMKMLRTYDCHFYHFVSLTTLTPGQVEKRRMSERDGHEYARYKWGNYISSDRKTNDKFILT